MEFDKDSIHQAKIASAIVKEAKLEPVTDKKFLSKIRLLSKQTEIILKETEIILKEREKEEKKLSYKIKRFLLGEVVEVEMYRKVYNRVHRMKL